MNASDIAEPVGDAGALCPKCKQSVKSPVICSVCHRTFHPACLRHHLSACKSEINEVLINTINSAVSEITNKLLCEIKVIKTNQESLISEINFLRSENKIMRNILNKIAIDTNENSTNNISDKYRTDTYESTDNISGVAVTLSNSDLPDNVSASPVMPHVPANLATNTNTGLTNMSSDSNRSTTSTEYSYAARTKTTKHAVIITPVNIQNASITDRDLRSKVKGSDYNITRMKYANNGAVVINCSDANCSETLASNAAQSLGVLYRVTTPKLKLPRIKIVSIKDKLSKEEIHDCLIKQNAVINENVELKVLHVDTITNSSGPQKFTAYIEVNGSCFKDIMDIGYLNVGWDRCRVFEDLKVMRCFQCCGFNHKIENCPKNNPTCAKCAEDHSTKDCKSESFKCANCVYAVDVLKREGIDLSHAAWDRLCPSYVRAVKVASSKIKYDGE